MSRLYESLYALYELERCIAAYEQCETKYTVEKKFYSSMYGKIYAPSDCFRKEEWLSVDNIKWLIERDRFQNHSEMPYEWTKRYDQEHKGIISFIIDKFFDFYSFIEDIPFIGGGLKIFACPFMLISLILNAIVNNNFRLRRHYTKCLEESERATSLYISQKKGALESEEQKIVTYQNRVKAMATRLYNDLNMLPKYRNLNALSYMCAYVKAGACTTLDGTGGAYDLYEQRKVQSMVNDSPLSFNPVSTNVKNLPVTVENINFKPLEDIAQLEAFHSKVDVLLKNIQNNLAVTC